MTAARCLVIGGAGNLGAHIVGLLLERGHTVSSFDLLPYAGPSADRVKSFAGDVTDAAALAAAMAGVRLVFHAATYGD